MKQPTVPFLKRQLHQAAWFPLGVFAVAILGVVAYVLQNQQFEKIQNTRYALSEIVSSQETLFSQEVYLNQGAALELRIDSILESWSKKYPNVQACVRMEFPRGQVSLIEKCSIDLDGGAVPFSAVTFEKRTIKFTEETVATLWFAVLRKTTFSDLFPPVLIITILLGLVGAGLAHRSLVARIENRILSPLLAKMREDQKKAAVTETTQMIAHDIRKPFQILRFALQSLISSRNEVVSRIGSQIAGDIEESVRSVNAMLTDMIDIGKEMQPVLSLVSPREVTEAVVSSMARLFPYSYPNLSLHFGHENMIQADREQIFRVLSNLIENAIHAAGANGSVTVKTETIHKNEYQHVIFSVENDGPEISAEAKERLFTPYFTTKKKGTGLGLAISQKIVTNHGGGIEWESSPGKTIFRFSLQTNSEADAYVKPTPGETALEKFKNRTVLVFDDEKAIHVVWRHYAQEHNHQTFCHFINWEDFVAQEAYELAKDAVAFVDIRYENSNYDGFQIARALKKLGVKRLYAMTSDQEAARKSGLFDAVLGKEIPSDFSTWVA